ncbi:DNA damage response protein [Grosmannia clavigera kw1407]|uniref:DNA damage response protein n=1 Tax=Grosmannia clavigera (strain kw1407 / UAMH 11150) TaxID=655863 RepID=F0XIR8_GROCL|nr:DNA damage response protein [Grosmannia clavigera kw1407]EFX02426.1 DNA damage response protein [Grosmannia clavigera kw1407]
MWLLDNVGHTFQGRRLWLRPGKRYLFGRTKAEPGQLVISDKTISRKHLTIEVGRVTEGDGTNRESRSVITIEDLNTKIGTVVNGTQIRGQRLVLSQVSNEVKMGHMADLFRITWHPVVLSFSLTTKELRADPWALLREQLEQLDIKYIAEYDIARTTHVVAKKRNTSKGLQALINGKYIVMESFLSAIEAAAGSSALEQDFDGSWPDALEFLPPRGDEPSDRPVSTYNPDERRKDIFDGYTFIFYDQKQYDNLFPPISNGKGKALLAEVIPGETQVDNFICYVKRIAGDQSLGEFEDGGEGKGVVVVRYLPAKGDHVEWFGRFGNAVSLRLDHRLIDQREFLDAILAVEPGMLRRSLQEDSGTPIVISGSADESTQMSAGTAPVADMTVPAVALPTRRGRARRGLTSRFKGFDADLDVENDPNAFPLAAESMQASEEGMFMSQTSAFQEPEPSVARKRPVAAVAEEGEDIMGDIAPTAAAVKRRRIAAGIEPVPPRQCLESEAADEGGTANGEGPAGSNKDGRGKGKKAEDNAILNQARKNREAAEKRAAEERERLAQIQSDGIDAEEIRRLTIVEEISVRGPTGLRTREQDVADGRWDPHWNGRRNFKKFRKQGDAAGRPIQRVIVGLEAVKTKEYGIGDDYWLEGENNSSWRRGPVGQHSTGGYSSIEVDSTVTSTVLGAREGRHVLSTATESSIGLSSVGPADGVADVEVILDTEPEMDSMDTMALEADLPRTRAGKVAQKTATRQRQADVQASLDTQTQLDVQLQLADATQTQTQSASTRGKRTASVAASGPRAAPAKKPRRGAAGAMTIQDSDSDSDDGLQFKFRSRR